MEHKTSFKGILAALGGALTVVLAMMALIPFLNRILAVEVTAVEPPVITSAPLPEKPEEVPVTVYYVMEENEKKISAVYIEVFPIGDTMVYYMELPVDTRLNLSEELYKSLQTYAPELPQYLKLSNMAEGFSREYSLTGCNRILSEVLGITFTDYVRVDAETIEQWFAVLPGEKKTADFFEYYTDWLDASDSSRTIEERWMYFESFVQVTDMVEETAPGSREKDGYLISGKRSGERLEELLIRRKITE